MCQGLRRNSLGSLGGTLRKFFPPLLIPPRLGSVADYLFPLLLGHLDASVQLILLVSTCHVCHFLCLWCSVVVAAGLTSPLREPAALLVQNRLWARAYRSKQRQDFKCKTGAFGSKPTIGAKPKLGIVFRFSCKACNAHFCEFLHTNPQTSCRYPHRGSSHPTLFLLCDQKRTPPHSGQLPGAGGLQLANRQRWGENRGSSHRSHL
jgi:hypothetical protein